MRTMTRRSRLALFLLPLFAAASACDLAMAEFKSKETAEWRKTYDLQPGGQLEIGNVNGKIEVEAASGTSVEVVAVKSASASSPEAAKEALTRIDIQETASPTSVRIETRLNRGGSFFSGGNLSVQYKVRVPAALEIKVTTVNGGIELRGLAGRVTAGATNGGIVGREIAGPIDASTVNGGVEIALSQVAESGVKLECTNGGIKLQLPRDAKADIAARISNGGIETSNLQIDSSGETSRRQLDGRLNGGGPRIRLEGTNGGIQISGR
jgi:putative adhesin